MQLPAAPFFVSDNKDNLYKLLGYTTEQDAIYRRTVKYGKDGIKELRYDTEVYQSMFPENKVTMSKPVMKEIDKFVSSSRPVTAAASILVDLLERKNTKSDKETLEVIKNCKIK